MYHPGRVAVLINIRLLFAGQSPLVADQGAVWRKPLPVAGALDDDLVAGVGQPIQRAVAEGGIVEEAEPFIHSAVAGDDEAGGPVPVEDEFSVTLFGQAIGRRIPWACCKSRRTDEESIVGRAWAGDPATEADQTVQWSDVIRQSASHDLFCAGGNGICGHQRTRWPDTASQFPHHLEGRCGRRTPCTFRN